MLSLKTLKLAYEIPTMCKVLVVGGKLPLGC